MHDGAVADRRGRPRRWPRPIDGPTGRCTVGSTSTSKAWPSRVQVSAATCTVAGRSGQRSESMSGTTRTSHRRTCASRVSSARRTSWSWPASDAAAAGRPGAKVSSGPEVAGRDGAQAADGGGEHEGGVGRRRRGPAAAGRPCPWARRASSRMPGRPGRPSQPANGGRHRSTVSVEVGDRAGRDAADGEPLDVVHAIGPDLPGRSAPPDAHAGTRELRHRHTQHCIGSPCPRPVRSRRPGRLTYLGPAWP